MTQIQQQKLAVEVSKVINAPVEKVFRAWTEPGELEKWFGGGMITGLKVQQDASVGGQYRLDSVGCDGKAGFVSGEYREIVPNKKLVFTWNNNKEEFPARDTLVTVEFNAKGD